MNTKPVEKRELATTPTTSSVRCVNCRTPVPLGDYQLAVIMSSVQVMFCDKCNEREDVQVQ